MSQNKTNANAKKFGYGYFIAAVIFLCNPYVNIVDILPDFFGYCFLIAGFSKLADLCPHIADAMSGVSRLRWFTLIKLLMILLIPLVDSTFVLLFTFSFAVIESIYLFPAIGKIFDGLEYLGTRHDGRAVYVNIKNVRVLTYFTFIVRFIFAVIPELCELSSFEYSGWVTAAPQRDIAEYKGVFTAIGLFFGLLACIIWLVNVIPYINRVKADSAFLARLSEAYDRDVASNAGIFHARHAKRIFALIIAGTAFLANLWVDGFNVIPSFVGGLFFIAAAYMLSKDSGASKKLVIAPVVYTLIAAAQFAVSVVFSMRYSIRDIEYKFEAYELYNLGMIFSVIEYISLAACAFFIARGVLKLVRRHLAPTSVQISDVHYKESVRSLYVSFGLLIAVIAANLVYSTVRAVIDPGWYIALLIATVAWAIYNASVLTNIHSHIEYKYM